MALEALDLSWPLQASWRANLVRGAVFFALMPFRYGLQYALMAVAYLWPTIREKGVSRAFLDELLYETQATSSLTHKVRPLQ